MQDLTENIEKLEQQMEELEDQLSPLRKEYQLQKFRLTETGLVIEKALGIECNTFEKREKLLDILSETRVDNSGNSYTLGSYIANIIKESFPNQTPESAVTSLKTKIKEFEKAYDVDKLYALRTSSDFLALEFEQRLNINEEIRNVVRNYYYQLSNGTITPMTLKKMRKKTAYILYLKWLDHYADKEPTAAAKLADEVRRDVENSYYANDEYIEGLFKQIALKCKKEQNNG